MADPVSLPTPAMEPESSDCSYVSDSSDLSDLSSPPASPQTPPGFYPSPPPSHDQEGKLAAGPKSRARAASGAGGQEEPARKKRRVGPMPRSTQHLDLSDVSEQAYARQQAQIDLLVKTLRTRRKIVVIAGAGISTSAGSESTHAFFFLAHFPVFSVVDLIFFHCSSGFSFVQWPLQDRAEEAQPQVVGQAALRRSGVPR